MQQLLAIGLAEVMDLVDSLAVLHQDEPGIIRVPHQQQAAERESPDFQAVLLQARIKTGHGFT
jgi:Fe-S cluster assembly ATPase SufC